MLPTTAICQARTLPNIVLALYYHHLLRTLCLAERPLELSAIPLFLLSYPERPRRVLVIPSLVPAAFESLTLRLSSDGNLLPVEE